MEKVQLDANTESLLIKKLHELSKNVPYDCFIRIEQIINEAISQHFILRHKIEEILGILQELEEKCQEEEPEVVNRADSFKLSCVSKHERLNNDAFHNQMFDYGVVKFKKIMLLLLAGKADMDERQRFNGVM